MKRGDERRQFFADDFPKFAINFITEWLLWPALAPLSIGIGIGIGVWFGASGVLLYLYFVAALLVAACVGVICAGLLRRPNTDKSPTRDDRDDDDRH